MKNDNITGKDYLLMNGTKRSDIKPGLHVLIVLKKDQRSGSLTKGIVADILTKSPTHPIPSPKISPIRS